MEQKAKPVAKTPGQTKEKCGLFSSVICTDSVQHTGRHVGKQTTSKWGAGATIAEGHGVTNKSHIEKISIKSISFKNK